MPTPSDTIFVPSIQRAVRLEPAALADLLRDRIVHPPTGRADDRRQPIDALIDRTATLPDATRDRLAVAMAALLAGDDPHVRDCVVTFFTRTRCEAGAGALVDALSAADPDVDVARRLLTAISRNAALMRRPAIRDRVRAAARSPCHAAALIIGLLEHDEPWLRANIETIGAACADAADVYRMRLALR